MSMLYSNGDVCCLYALIRDMFFEGYGTFLTCTLILFWKSCDPVRLFKTVRLLDTSEYVMRLEFAEMSLLLSLVSISAPCDIEHW